jgi:glycosyl transferase, family 25
LRVHFINLDRSQDRLVEFRKMNSHLSDAVRFSAIDGHRLDIESLARQGLLTRDIFPSYSVGAVGVALSHRSLWQVAAERNEMLTIAEDDVIFHSQFETLAQEIIKTLPRDWDFVLWGWNFDAFLAFDMVPGVSTCRAQFDSDSIRLKARAFQRLPLSPRAHKLILSFGMTCYSISPKGAENLKSKCFPLRPMFISWPADVPRPAVFPSRRNVGIDAVLNSLYRQLNAYVCFPPLVVTENERGESTIQHEGSAPQIVLETAPVIEAPSINLDDVAILVSRGVEFQTVNRLEDALAQYDKALALKPNDIAALSNRGSVLMDLGRFAEALSNYDLLSIWPNDFNALNMRGLALEQLKRFADALASYDKAIAIAPGAVEAFYNRGNVLADLGRFEEALASYDKALEIKHDAAPILNNRGLVLEELGRYEEALANYEQAVGIKPDYHAAAENRRLLLQELDRSRNSLSSKRQGP